MGLEEPNRAFEMAQVVEHPTVLPVVEGSNPTNGVFLEMSSLCNFGF